MVTRRKRLGVSPHFYCLPIIKGLQQDARFELSVDTPANIAAKLREHDLDAAFLSPIDYALDSSEYQIVPAVIVSSARGNDTVTLHFRGGLRKISTVAVDPSFASESVLARIVLAERFETKPELVPVSGPLESMLREADAALLVGDAALRSAARHANRLDLIEEWNDLADLPYVHGFWCGREGALARGDILRLQEAREEGVSELEAISIASAGRFPGISSPRPLQEYLKSFSYEMTEDARAGLSEFLRYAFYFGILPDVPELHLSGANEGETSGLDDLPLN